MDSKIAKLKSRVRGGVLPAMATPLHSNGYRVNVQVVDQLLEFLVGAGASGLFVGGTTGEGILLDLTERMALHERAVSVAGGRVPVIVHIGANTTADSTKLAAHAQSIGADAIAAVTPYYYPIHDDSLVAYYGAIAAAAPATPFLGYDIPHMAVNLIRPAVLTKLSADLPTFSGLKSSRKDALEVRQLVDAAAGQTLVLAGNERVALGLLALGVDGLISGLSTAIPEPFVALTRAHAMDDLEEARKQQQLINQILDLIPAGYRIGALKSLLIQRGIAAGPPVPPRQPTPDDWQVWPEVQAYLETT